MSIKVLVFESDSAFAGELRNELGNLGCAVRIVDDGNVGLQQAQAERPDLILLSIELPRMNGFSVCNKLKKDPDLKDVPLIIMSSESSDETFEQHKKLRTRAEAYVHKPLAFGDLLREIDPFVSLTGDGLASTGDARDLDDADDSSAILIEDDDGPEPIAAQRSIESKRLPAQAQAGVDPDIDAFADDAFGRLQASPEPGTQTYQAVASAPSRSEPPPPVARPKSNRPPPASTDGAFRKADAEQARAEVEAAKAEAGAAEAKADALQRELDLAKEEGERAREEAEAEATRLKRELEELRARPQSMAPKGGSNPPKGGTGVTSREFLDLRETLSKKDKELLALKQQLTVKDKEIFETRDRSLAHESRASELDDRVLAKDRELAEVGERVEDLNGQLESQKKATADIRTEVDRLEKQLEDLRGKRDQENVAHEAAAAALRADNAAAQKRLREESADALAKAQASFRNELDAAEAGHIAAREDLVREHTAALASQRTAYEKKLADALAAAEAARETLAKEHLAALAVQRAASEKQLGEAEARAAAAREVLVSEHAAAMAAKAEEAEKQKAEAIAARETQVRAELKAETDTKLAALHRGQQEELQRVRSEAEGRETKLKEEIEKGKEQAEGLERRLADAASARAKLETELAAAVAKGAGLEGDLTGVRGELDKTRADLSRETSRSGKAFAKWEADKASLERAKDALAVALSQLDEAETRPITD